MAFCAMFFEEPAVLHCDATIRLMVLSMKGAYWRLHICLIILRREADAIILGRIILPEQCNMQYLIQCWTVLFFNHLMDGCLGIINMSKSFKHLEPLLFVADTPE